MTVRELIEKHGYTVEEVLDAPLADTAIDMSAAFRALARNGVVVHAEQEWPPGDLRINLTLYPKREPR